MNEEEEEEFYFLERTFQKMLERERSVEREAAERERSGQRAKSAAQSPLVHLTFR